MILAFYGGSEQKILDDINELFEFLKFDPKLVKVLVPTSTCYYFFDIDSKIEKISENLPNSLERLVISPNNLKNVLSILKKSGKVYSGLMNRANPKDWKLKINYFDPTTHLFAIKFVFPSIYRDLFPSKQVAGSGLHLIEKLGGDEEFTITSLSFTRESLVKNVRTYFHKYLDTILEVDALKVLVPTCGFKKSRIKLHCSVEIMSPVPQQPKERVIILKGDLESKLNGMESIVLQMTEYGWCYSWQS